MKVMDNAQSDWAKLKENVVSAETDVLSSMSHMTVFSSTRVMLNYSRTAN